MTTSKPYKLFLDDVRFPNQVKWIPEVSTNWRDWAIVRNCKEFSAIINERGIPSEVSFDHDLGYDMDTKEEITGIDCLRVLAAECIKRRQPMPKCFIHSQNPVGRDNLINLIKHSILGINQIISNDYNEAANGE